MFGVELPLPVNFFVSLVLFVGWCLVALNFHIHRRQVRARFVPLFASAFAMSLSGFVSGIHQDVFGFSFVAVTNMLDALAFGMLILYALMFYRFISNKEEE